jgi:hypothetical protein
MPKQLTRTTPCPPTKYNHVSCLFQLSSKETRPLLATFSINQTINNLPRRLLPVRPSTFPDSKFPFLSLLDRTSMCAFPLFMNQSSNAYSRNRFSAEWHPPVRPVIVVVATSLKNLKFTRPKCNIIMGFPIHAITSVACQRFFSSSSSFLVF